MNSWSWSRPTSSHFTLFQPSIGILTKKNSFDENSVSFNFDFYQFQSTQTYFGDNFILHVLGVI